MARWRGCRSPPMLSCFPNRYRWKVWPMCSNAWPHRTKKWPRRNPSRPLPDIGGMPDMTNLEKLKILIVDDESDSREVLKGALEDMGITDIVEAPDAKDA